MPVDFLKKDKRRLHHYFIPHPANDHKPHFVRHGALHFYSGLLIAVKVLVIVLLFITYPSPAEFSTVTSSRIIELTNQARQQQGLPVLMHNSLLDQSAMLKARDMLKNDYFAHNSPADNVTPWEWFKQVGYNYTFAGENLAMNFSEAEQAVDAWLDSPTHRANIMNGNYAEIGVAVVVGKIYGQETTLVVQHFGKTFLASRSPVFNRQSSEQVPEIAGTTQVATGRAIEVTFKHPQQGSLAANLAYYTQKFFLILLIFIGVNLLLTIFIRIKVQHKPIIMHSILVIFIGLLVLLLHPHFIESVVSGSVKIL